MIFNNKIEFNLKRDVLYSRFIKGSIFFDAHEAIQILKARDKTANGNKKHLLIIEQYIVMSLDVLSIFSGQASMSKFSKSAIVINSCFLKLMLNISLLFTGKMKTTRFFCNLQSAENWLEND